MSLLINDLACGYAKRTVLKHINLKIETGEVLCILGPNGVGKSTLFKTIQGFLAPHSGQILLNGKSISKWSRKQLAKNLAYVPQTHEASFPYTVSEVVLMGRTAHLGNFSSPRIQDYEICEEILTKLKISHLASSIYTQISGGERQLVLIARALAQKPLFLMMDEPTSNLDFGNQVKVLQQIVNLAESGMGIIMTTHFPDHAFLCSGKVALFKPDHSYSFGSANEVITEASLAEAYGIPVKMSQVQNLNGENLKTCIPMLNKAETNAPKIQNQLKFKAYQSSVQAHHIVS
ncbi:MAG: ABC transporter ATP-binding protein [Clostridia bacterium]|nr:ABC transporter ATP-binding protein [Clostridia bacterium]